MNAREDSLCSHVPHQKGRDLGQFWSENWFYFDHFGIRYGFQATHKSVSD